MGMTFPEWLVAEEYSPASVEKMQQQVALARRTMADRPPETARSGVRAYLRYFVSTEQPPGEFEQRMDELGYVATTRGPRKAYRRKLEHRSFDEGDWRQIAKLVENDDSPAARVIQLLMATGLRIQDALGITREQLIEGFERGSVHVQVKGGHMQYKPLKGDEDAWHRMQPVIDEGCPNVATYVSPRSTGSPMAGKGAYKAVSRLLKVFGIQVDAVGRVHLHRIRRTFAVQVLNETDNVVAAQQALGHAHHSTTQKYVDEVNEQKIAEIQQKLKAKYRGGS